LTAGAAGKEMVSESDLPTTAKPIPTVAVVTLKSADVL
jgi:hypothetical protein